MTLPPPLAGEARERLLQAWDRIASFAQRVESRLGDQISCGQGCHDCCHQVLRLRGVEASLLLEGARSLSGEAMSLVWQALEDALEICPLLHGGLCLVYGQRPAVCRTHGLPLLRQEEGTTLLHHCPRSFPDSDPRDLSPSLILDEERLALLMDAVDAVYCRQTGWGGERVDLVNLLRAGLAP
ncbi:MAG: YkgJ family cysteine cluster protein [Proteobacteria bacterium]|nr:YkgJ family cysteine cluster protein [Pseudomonadota bacterium]